MNEFEKINPNTKHESTEHEKSSLSSQPELVENQNIYQEKLVALDSFKKTPEELKKINEIRRKIEKKASASAPQQKELIFDKQTEIQIINGQQYCVEYVPKEDIYPAYGYANGNIAVVRQDLPPRVKKFVKAHELYHCLDKSNFGGWLGKEFRANIIPGLKDPVGLVATVWKTITDIERIRLYLKRVKKGY